MPSHTHLSCPLLLPLQASNINKSLLWLGQVMRALGDGHKHIVFRDSKLTRILQHSLSGNGHMAIICTISPAAGMKGLRGWWY